MMGEGREVPERPWETALKQEIQYCLYPGCGEMIYVYRGQWRHVSQDLDHEPVITLYRCKACGDPVQRVRHHGIYQYRHSDGDRFYDHKAVVKFEDLDNGQANNV